MKKLLPLILLIALVSLFLFFVSNQKLSHPSSSLIFKMAESNLTQATWSEPIEATEQTPMGNITGEKITGALTNDTAILSHFEDANELSKLGFTPDQNLSADGPGSSQWGYTKKTDEGTQVLIFSYNTTPTSNNPDEPLRFYCPCEMTVSVFLGSNEQENTPQALANPASVNCKKLGGTTVIKNGPNGQYGLCQFEDNQACEEWALFRNECPVGGVKTTGFDTIEQMYCAWVGGETLAVANPNCKLPDGTICTDDAVYNGTCPTPSN